MEQAKIAEAMKYAEIAEAMEYAEIAEVIEQAKIAEAMENAGIAEAMEYAEIAPFTALAAFMAGVCTVAVCHIVDLSKSVCGHYSSTMSSLGHNRCIYVCIPYGRKVWREIYFGGLAVVRAIRQYFIRQINFKV